VVGFFQTDHGKSTNADEDSEGKGEYHLVCSNIEQQLADANVCGFVTEKFSDERYSTI
jgi:hypothetical protein